MYPFYQLANKNNKNNWLTGAQLITYKNFCSILKNTLPDFANQLGL